MLRAQIKVMLMCTIESGGKQMADANFNQSREKKGLSRERGTSESLDMI